MFSVCILKFNESSVISIQKNFQSKLKLLSHFIFKRLFKVRLSKLLRVKRMRLFIRDLINYTTKHQIRISFFNCINNCEREADTRCNRFSVIDLHPSLYNENKKIYLSLESWNKNDAMFLTNPLSPCFYFLGGVSFFSTPSPFR